MARFRDRPPLVVSGGELPAELRVCVIETWCPDPDDPDVVRLQRPEDDVARLRAITAWQRWKRARGQWAQANGFSRRDLHERFAGRHTPLSWDYLTERDPELLARILADHGLPPDWTPDV